MLTFTETTRLIGDGDEGVVVGVGGGREGLDVGGRGILFTNHSSNDLVWVFIATFSFNVALRPQR